MVAGPADDVRRLQLRSSSTRPWRAFSGTNYFSEPYLSPFYSPCLGDCVEGSSDFGQPFAGFPLSAALIILIFPLGFRMTCYYYRKAYYRAFWLSPPACAVAEPHGKYSGETRFPLILQNIHRYFWYAAVVVALILTLRRGPGVRSGRGRVRRHPHGPRHAADARSTSSSSGSTRCPATPAGTPWAAGCGTSPSTRSATGSGPGSPKLNVKHARYAWVSLFSVALVDLYIYLLAAGVFDDPRFF